MEYKYKTLLELEKKRQFLNNSSFTNSLLSSVFIILFLVLIVIFYGQYFNYKDKIFLFIDNSHGKCKKYSHILPLNDFFKA